ncbi:glycosyltransferase family 2 protein [Streptomyces sp. NBC_00237]|uniref:glycosyltransferase family 2 protein n=1 Tax=Streptomyces sp. NBC_00237 TaxID=2975687 RepID=UPI002254A2AA|nr:glycosyltransferase family 2 protein [Streptomyces sp. NBC_00237]MCX5200826.1 glycosyltransferase family 2 protein [Streptomyces sp. NBC_00237]
MSVSQPTAPYAAAATPPEFPRHVVTAVLVSHDGARWLPDVLRGLLGQERPVQNAVAADTGSADDSARLVTEAFGDERVLHLARRTGFGTAVEEAVRTAGVLTPEELPYLKKPSGWDPVSRQWRDDAYDQPDLPHGEPVQWLWLLHDDCAPAPDALAELLRVADSDHTAAIVGPKLRGWYDKKQLLEVGVSIANSGRRWTGLDRREQDQGQHDQVRSVLSVSSAGMLIRRDVWEQLGGFDRHLPLMRDDVDLCWRAHAAGHSVLVAPDASVRHAEASARERRTVDCVGRGVANPHRVDKAGAVYTMLANARGAVLPYVLLRLVVGTLLRTLAYLVGKVPGQAVDEVTGLLSVLLRPGRVLAARKARGKGVIDPSELRPLFPPPGATLRATVEQVAGSFGSGNEAETGGSRHGAVESGPGGDDADFLEVEQFARVKKVARKPGPVLFALLLLVALVACRELLVGDALAGGALLPSPESASELWSRYAHSWHPTGTGGTQSAPPYLALLASFATLLLGSTNAALTVLLVCSVPLAGLTAYFASRPLVESRLLRAWASVAYAFLPAVTGALAGGRIGTAVLAVLLPLIARCAVSASGARATAGARSSWRSVWAYALLLTLATAFTPVVWPLAALLGIGVLVLRRNDITAYALRFVAAIGTPLLVLAPWSLSLLTEPASLLREAGLPYGGGAATPLDLLGISPGGPKTAGGLLLIGIVLAALAALLRGERQFAVRSAWVVAILALVFAVLANRDGWAGPATLVYGLALIAATVLGADGARERVASQNFGWRQPVAVLIAAAAALGPVLAAVGWMFVGAADPIGRRDPVQVPAFVAEESTTRDQPRTLVLGGGSADKVAYSLLRGSGGRLGDAELTRAGGSAPNLDKIVSNLVAGSGADQAGQLGGYAVRYVLVRDGVAARQMSRVLDSTPGLIRLSQLDGSALWRVERQVARLMIVSPRKGAEPVPVAAQPIEAHTTVKEGDEGRVLRLADSAAPGWKATLDGRELTKKTLDGWAQGFELPAQGGKLDLTYKAPLTHTAWLWAQGALAVVLVVLALPGRRREIDDDLPDSGAAAAADFPAAPVEGEGRRARRLRAAAEAEAEQAPEPAPVADPYASPYPDQEGAPDAPFAAVPPQGAYGEWDAQSYANAGAGQGQGQYGAQDPYQQPQQGYGDNGYDYDPYGYTQQPSQDTPAQEQPQQQPFDAFGNNTGTGDGGSTGSGTGSGYYGTPGAQQPSHGQQPPAYSPQPYDPYADDQGDTPHGSGDGRPYDPQNDRQRPDGSNNR